jgi:hypothetical protein
VTIDTVSTSSRWLVSFCPLLVALLLASACETGNRPPNPLNGDLLQVAGGPDPATIGTGIGRACAQQSTFNYQWCVECVQARCGMTVTLNSADDRQACTDAGITQCGGLDQPRPPLPPLPYPVTNPLRQPNLNQVRCPTAQQLQNAGVAVGVTGLVVGGLYLIGTVATKIPNPVAIGVGLCALGIAYFAAPSGEVIACEIPGSCPAPPQRAPLPADCNYLVWCGDCVCNIAEDPSNNRVWCFGDPTPRPTGCDSNSGGDW